MPNIDGIHASEQIKEDNQVLNKTFPIIYLRNKETQQTLRVIVSIQYDARFKCK